MSNKRPSLSRAVRFRVMARDNFRCVYCGATPEATSLHIDHLLPVNAGGGNEVDNLVTACADCNLGKRDSIVSEMIDRGLERGASEALSKISEIVAEFRNQVTRHVAQACWSYATMGRQLHLFEANRMAGLEMEYDTRGEEPDVLLEEPK